MLAKVFSLSSQCSGVFVGTYSVNYNNGGEDTSKTKHAEVLASRERSKKGDAGSPIPVKLSKSTPT
jgi:hypothetical protein